MQQRTIRLLVLCAAALTIAAPAQAALNVLTCEPEWAALAQELGGERVKVASATTALQDPHRVEARPSLIARARNAGLLICTGADLEIGWLPILLRESANPSIQPGQPGNFEAAQYVMLLEKPARLDRADGDVHAAGNPHIQTDPRNIGRVAAALTARLASIDPGNAAYYDTRHNAFKTRWNTAIGRWEKQAAPLRGTAIAVQHKAFPYLQRWLGLREVVALEPLPGVEPSVASLAGVLEKLRHTPVKMVIRASYSSPRASQWISGRAGIPAVELPFTVGGTPGAGDLFGLFDDTIARLLKANE